MTFAIADEFLPAVLTCHPMSDDEFVAFCAEHPDLNFEMTAEGELIVMAPTYSDTGARNSELAVQLGTGPERIAAVSPVIRQQDSFCRIAPGVRPMRPGR